MKVPLSLLLKFCDPGLPVEEIASILALTGTEVERVTKLGVEDPSTFVVGHVVSCEKHPDADRLNVCSVDIGGSEPTQIVCGAPNVAAGQLVPVALTGSVMPNGLKIKKAKLRGVESNGMICAEDELGLSRSHEGILILPESSGPAGRPLADVLPLGETVLELEITPNRPDCLGVYGVARELHAATGAPLAPAPWAVDHGTSGDLEGFALDVADPAVCPRFTARIYEIEGVGETPMEIQGHLTAAGMRPISPVVDITNYTMLVIGEPLHAFDLDKLDGQKLTVRSAAGGEKLTTLDGQERTLEAGDPVIDDASGPTSIAGVMGGARSEVGEGTTRVLLEAAVWHGPTINSTSNRLNLRSEASGRFEKGLAPALTDRGQAFASQLFSQFFGATPNQGTAVAGQDHPDVTIKLAASKVESLVGGAWSVDRIVKPLEALGFGVTVAGGVLDVTVPSDRLDVRRDVDLIEEIVRIDGLDGIEPTLPSGNKGGLLSRGQRIRREVADELGASGLFEIAGWSFANPNLGDRLRLAENDARRVVVELENPMSSEEAHMRTTLIGSLLESAGTNVARGASYVRLFEIGPVYLPSEEGLADEPIRVATLLVGPSVPPDWGNPAPPSVDIHSGTALLERVLGSQRVTWKVLPARDPEPFLHPVRSGVIEIDGHIAGWMGELHPEVAAEFGLPNTVVAEFDLKAVESASQEVVHYAPVSPHPVVSQDLAVLLPLTVASADAVAAAQHAGGAELESVAVFDVYEGDGVDPGFRSLGLRFVFRAHDRTLTEDEATAARAAILAVLESELGAKQRG
jgi:phenylalanyl-tRNA synthetase beta chain